MTVSDIIAAIEGFAPSHYQESWDNTGLQVGDRSAECTGVLVCVDVTPGVVDEAISRGCNLIVSHHPLLFNGLKSITGATPKEERVRLVERFNANEVPVFLISLKAGGTGLNLTGASVVIHADPWWNAAAQNQATDRAHRIGQTRDVSVFKVIADGTIEERIVRLQEAKSSLADAVLGADSASLAALSRDELIELLAAD